MSDTLEPLILDLLEFIGPKSRLYTEVIDARRTSCLRLPVWEEANERDFLEQHHAPGEGMMVSVTDLGRKHLTARRSDRKS